MIEVKHLTKRYGSHTAVSDLSFTVEKGQIYGFLGPNGAGKSTTMNIMTGCLAATSGEVVIGGYDIFQDAAQAKRLIGYLPEQPPLYLDRTPKEYLRFVARAKGIPEKNISAELDRVMTVTGTLDVADRLMKNLSKGYRQRVGIAQAVLGDPEVIILDEPTVGLDPRQITEIRELIRQLGKEHTVILSSHILSEVQQVCTTILILSKGKLVACDTPENLERLFAGKSTVELTVEAAEKEIPGILSGVSHIVNRTARRRQDGACDVTLELDIPAEDGSPVTSDALEAKKREFRKLIGGEYKDLYQQEVSRALDQRFRKNRGLEAKLGEYQPLIDLMMDRYGVANGDLGQLQRAIESDETYWEAAAEDAGMSTEQYKEFAQMKRENGQMRQALEQRQRQQSVEAQLQRWYSQAEEARQAYPDLDLERESQDPRFLGMLKAGVPVQHAYEVIHMDAIKAGVAQSAAQTAARQVTDNVRARGARPAENGVSSGSGFLVKSDVSKLTKKDRAEIARRAAHGEKIVF